MVIASPMANTKESERPHACPGVKNHAMVRDELCRHRIGQEWKACSKCEHTKRLKGG